VQDAIVGVLAEDGVGPHDQPDFELDVGDRRLDALRTALRHDARRIARIGLLDGQPAQRQALCLVAVEQGRPGVAPDDRGKLPCEVERVLDAGVAPEAAVRRHDVRRVAREKHAALVKPLGPVRLGLPVGDVNDLHRHVGPDGGAQILQRSLLGQPRLHVDRRVLRDVLTHRVDDEEAVGRGPVEPEEPAQLRIVHVEHALVAIAQQLGAVGAEVDRDASRELSVAAHGDPQPSAHRAPIAVRGDDVPRSDLTLVAGAEVAKLDRHTVVVLRKADRLRTVEHRGPELERPLAQQRLEHVLVDEDAPGRAEPLNALVQLLDVGGELATRERLDGDDAPRRAIRLQRLRADPVLEPELAKYLHRPKLEVSCSRVDRSAGVALHRQRRHAVVTEQHGGRQPHEAAADDQDGHFLLRHDATLAAPATTYQRSELPGSAFRRCAT
jgi:hypothetical protein